VEAIENAGLSYHLGLGWCMSSQEIDRLHELAKAVQL
jgi:hypothetical protein